MPMIFTQGINEKQSMAVVFGNTSSLQYQQDINRRNLQRLQRYYAKYHAHALSMGVDTEVFNQVDYNLGRLAAEVATSKLNKKNFRVLMLAADLARELGGARITSCKSAKDRTSMAITHEQSRILGIEEEPTLDFANVMREFGPRLANCMKNVGARAFAFNKLQRVALPAEYTPPSICCGGIE